MDHSWGRNIYAAGLGDFESTLAARIPGFVGEWYLVNRDRRAPTAVVVRKPLDTEPSVPYIYSTVAKLTANFPYGVVVTPDAPV